MAIIKAPQFTAAAPNRDPRSLMKPPKIGGPKNVPNPGSLADKYKNVLGKSQDKSLGDSIQSAVVPWKTPRNNSAVGRLKGVLDKMKGTTLPPQARNNTPMGSMAPRTNLPNNQDSKTYTTK